MIFTAGPPARLAGDAKRRVHLAGRFRVRGEAAADARAVGCVRTSVAAGARVGGLAGGAFHGHDNFTQPHVIDVKMDLRFEFTRPRGFQDALEILGGAGGNRKRWLTLQTEAAIRASAELIANDSDVVAGGVAQAKLHVVLAYRKGREFAVRYIDDRPGRVLKEIQVSHYEPADDRTGENYVPESFQAASIHGESAYRLGHGMSTDSPPAREASAGIIGAAS